MELTYEIKYAKLNKLNASLEKSNEKVEKCKATIERHIKRIERKKNALAKLGFELNTDDVKIKGSIKEFNDSIKPIEDFRLALDREEQGKEYLLGYDIHIALEDLWGAYKKLKEAEKINNNWRVKVIEEQSKVDFAKSAPKVIVDFVDEWGEMAFKWFMENEKNPIESNIRSFVENEKRIKVIQLTMRVTDVVGNIVDASGLDIGEKGDLIGYIKGEKGTAKVETISAGGYAIQCFHYRTIVTKL